MWHCSDIYYLPECRDVHSEKISFTAANAWQNSLATVLAKRWLVGGHCCLCLRGNNGFCVTFSTPHNCDTSAGVSGPGHLSPLLPLWTTRTSILLWHHRSCVCNYWRVHHHDLYTKGALSLDSPRSARHAPGQEHRAVVFSCILLADSRSSRSIICTAVCVNVWNLSWS